MCTSPKKGRGEKSRRPQWCTKNKTKPTRRPQWCVKNKTKPTRRPQMVRQKQTSQPAIAALGIQRYSSTLSRRAVEFPDAFKTFLGVHVVHTTAVVLVKCAPLYTIVPCATRGTDKINQINPKDARRSSQNCNAVAQAHALWC